jgi:hypothetical protein
MLKSLPAVRAYAGNPKNESTLFSPMNSTFTRKSTNGRHPSSFICGKHQTSIIFPLAHFWPFCGWHITNKMNQKPNK